jgi:DNA sulfur modification protein DndD
MKIEQLHLQNWRGYEGEEHIKFSTDPKKNINLIIAENGTGKSNLMEAIYWCLYDELPPNANTQEEIITDSASVKRLKAKVQVKIIDPRENKTYLLSRELKANDAQSEAIAMELENGRNDKPRKYSGSYALLVDRLLPKVLSSFFLFSGEGAKNYFKLHSGDNTLKTSIENVQGLQWANEAFTELEDQIELLTMEISKSSTSKGKAEQLSIEIESLEKEEELEEKKLEKYKSDYKKAFTRMNQISKQINESGVDQAEALENERNAIVGIIASAKTRITENEDNQKNLLNSYSFYVLAYEMKAPMDELFQTMQSEDLIPGEISEPFVNKILDRGTCICGRDFEADSKEQKNIEKIKETAETEDMENWRQKSFALFESFDTYNKKFQEEYDVYAENIEDAENEIKERNDRLKKISDELKDLEIKDIKQLIEEREKLSTDQFNLSQNQIPISSEKLKEVKKNIKDKKANIQKLHMMDPGDPKFKKLAFMQQAHERLDKLINKLRVEGREKILEHLNELTSKYSRKGHRFKYRDEGSFFPEMLSSKQSKEPPLNSGDLVMKAIFYASSIIRFCRDRFDDKKTVIQPGTIAPMVVDAVLSDLDRKNSESLSEVLCNTPEQLIIFLNEEAFHKGFEKAVGNKETLGTLYFLQRSVRDKGVDEKIEIFGKKYTPFLHNQAIERTEVKEINI